MSKKKLLSLSLLSLIALGLAGAGMVSAQGGWWRGSVQDDPVKFAEQQNQMFSRQAALLGLSQDQVKAYWAEGKNLKEIAAEIGLNDADLRAKMKQERENGLQEELRVLVANGVITQAQADARLQSAPARGLSVWGKGRGSGRCAMAGMNDSAGCPCQNTDSQ